MNSSELKILANQQEDDNKFWQLLYKAGRAKKEEIFKRDILHLIEEKYDVQNEIDGKYTIFTEKHGTLDYFPRSNRLLVRKGNKWDSNGAFKLKRLLFPDMNKFDDISPEKKAEIVKFYTDNHENQMSIISEKFGVSKTIANKIVSQHLNSLKPWQK